MEHIYAEKCTASAQIKHLMRPSDQNTLVLVEEGKRRSWLAWLIYVFLPCGYPAAVSEDYLSYQVWDTAQAFASTMTGILATKEVLQGVGVGDMEATPLAAVITWVIKDGCGHIGRICFAFSYGTQLDAYSKKWRLCADILNDCAMCLEMALAQFPHYTTLVLCISTTMKAIVGVAGGATRAALTQHHARCGNMADVAAKDSAQETAVNLVASFAALLLITTEQNSTMYAFWLLIVLHIICNYLAVKSVCLKSFNEPRFIKTIGAYLRLDIAETPQNINLKEPLLVTSSLDLRFCGFKIRLGCSISNVADLSSMCDRLKNIQSVYSKRNYLLIPDTCKREMYVLLRENVSVEDTLRAYFHATILSIIICSLNNEVPDVRRNIQKDNLFEVLCQDLQNVIWSRRAVDRVFKSGFRFEPTQQLFEIIDDLVQKQWGYLKHALVNNGWDLSKSLLITEEWRILGPERASEGESEESSVSTPCQPYDELLANISLETEMYAHPRIRDLSLVRRKIQFSS